MMIYLSESQQKLVQLALEAYQRNLREQLKEPLNPKIKAFIEPDLFQLDLLVTWFDR